MARAQRELPRAVDNTFREVLPVGKRIPGTACGYCGIPLPIIGPGRPRQYCSAAHRQRAYERRNRGFPSLSTLAELAGYLCAICGGPVDLAVKGPEGPSIDHRLPLARGGTSDPDNLQLAHRRCNTIKRDRLNVTLPSIGVPSPQGRLFG